MPGISGHLFKTVTTATGQPAPLQLHSVEPAMHDPSRDRRPAIVLFHGGGWTSGSPAQMQPYAKALAGAGFVGLVAEYRTADKHGSAPADAVADARGAMRYVRAHAERLGIDPNRVAAAGGSAGGHLAACCALLDGPDDTRDHMDVSPRPDALVLLNPVLDTTEDGFGSHLVGPDPERLSPLHHVTAEAPPAIVFHGEADATVPADVARDFTERMREAGNRCDLHLYKGREHGFFNAGRNGGDDHTHTVERITAFFISLGWIPPNPDLQPAKKNETLRH